MNASRVRQFLSLAMMAGGFIALSGSSSPGCGGGGSVDGGVVCPLDWPSVPCACPLTEVGDLDGDGCPEPPVCRCDDPCTASGGMLVNECPPCPPGEICPLGMPCVAYCQCPDGTVVDPAVGCLPPVDDERLCAATGGTWQTLCTLAGPDGSSFWCDPAGDPTCGCSSFCECPPGTAFVSGAGCLPVPGPIVCGGFGGFWCPDGLVCVDDPSDRCDPASGGADCPGICVAPPPIPCGGFGGFLCPDGLVCVDDPSDRCDPASGGADCPGICVEPDRCAASGGRLVEDCFACIPEEPCPPRPCCICPDGTVVDPAVGCGAPPPPTDACTASGGRLVEECFACIPEAPCPPCVVQCICPDGTVVDPAVGCVAVPPTDACTASGGRLVEDCPVCIPGEPCPMRPCLLQCICPDGTIVDPTVGCGTPPPPPPPIEPIRLCFDTGGFWNECGSACASTRCGAPPPDPSGTCIMLCVPQCECPPALCFDDTRGCVPAP